MPNEQQRFDLRTKIIDDAGRLTRELGSLTIGLTVGEEIPQDVKSRMQAIMEVFNGHYLTILRACMEDPRLKDKAEKAESNYQTARRGIAYSLGMLQL